VALGHYPFHSAEARPCRSHRRLPAYAGHADRCRRVLRHTAHRRRIGQAFSGSSLLRPQSSGLALAVEAWAERDLFWPIARYVSGTNAEAVDPGLHVDRAALRGKRTPTIERLKAVARAYPCRVESGGFPKVSG
jgi:hypothetical protein